MSRIELSEGIFKLDIKRESHGYVMASIDAFNDLVWFDIENEDLERVAQEFKKFAQKLEDRYVLIKAEEAATAPVLPIVKHAD